MRMESGACILFLAHSSISPPPTPTGGGLVSGNAPVRRVDLCLVLVLHSFIHFIHSLTRSVKLPEMSEMCQALGCRGE